MSKYKQYIRRQDEDKIQDCMKNIFSQLYIILHLNEFMMTPEELMWLSPLSNKQGSMDAYSIINEEKWEKVIADFFK